jgi:hypothetical protein
MNRVAIDIINRESWLQMRGCDLIASKIAALVDVVGSPLGGDRARRAPQRRSDICRRGRPDVETASGGIVWTSGRA